MTADSKYVKQKDSIFAGIPIASSNNLKLCNSNLNDGSCAILADHIEKNKHLEKIEIINCNISDKGFSTITTSLDYLAHLSSLVIKGNNIGENFNEFNNNCLQLSKLKSLEFIDFSYNRIKNECFKGLKCLILARNLKSLILSNNLIDNECAGCLLELQKSSNIEIDLKGNSKFEEIRNLKKNEQSQNEYQVKECDKDFCISDVHNESEPLEPENFNYMSSPERNQIESSFQHPKINFKDNFRSPMKGSDKKNFPKNKKLFTEGMKSNEKKLNQYDLEQQLLEEEKIAVQKAVESENKNLRDLMDAKLSEKEINIRKLNLLIQQITKENSNLKDTNFGLEDKIIKIEQNYTSQLNIEKEKLKEYKIGSESSLIEVKGQISVLTNEIKRLKMELEQKEYALNLKTKDHEKLNVKFLAVNEKYMKEVEQLKSNHIEKQSLLENALNESKLQVKALKERAESSLKSIKDLFESSINSFSSQFNDFSADTNNKLDQLTKSMLIIEKKKEEISIQYSNLLSNYNRQKANYEKEVCRNEKKSKNVIENFRQNLINSYTEKVSSIASSRE